MADLKSEAHISSPVAWCGRAGAADKWSVDCFLRKLYHCGSSQELNIEILIRRAEENLLSKVKNSECHVLRPLFPPLAQKKQALRLRAHDFALPHKDDKNYIPRILYRLGGNSVLKI